MRPTAALLLALPMLVSACTPYAVATTARPLARGERSESQIFTVVPGGARSPDDSSSVAMPGIDLEQRFGLDERSDLGVRVPTFSGVVVTYKRRLDGITDEPGAATGLMVGGGFVNYGQHAHLEATLIRSGSETGRTVPYGGIRALQVIPLSSTAPHDSPTIGGFGGMRFGDRDGGISAELGVFYDRSALKLRRGDLVVVPSITVHGGALRRLVPGGRGWGARWAGRGGQQRTPEGWGLARTDPNRGRHRSRSGRPLISPLTIWLPTPLPSPTSREVQCSRGWARGSATNS